MAEEVLGLVVTGLQRLHAEASQARENREALLELANVARDAINPQIQIVRSNIRTSNQDHVKAALAPLLNSTQSVADLISRRGKARSALMLPVDALLGTASKVHAEIEGAKLNIYNAIHVLNFALSAANMGLQNQALSALDDLGQKLAGTALQDPHPNSKNFPWTLNFSGLEYKKNKRGMPTEILGSGGFGRVFRATYNGAEVAVKEPHNPADLHRDEGLRGAFFKEADMLYKMNHRNVVAFVGGIATDEDGDTCYMLVTELLMQTLSDLPTRHDPVETRQFIFRGIAEGLAYLHSMSIVHRDVKPQNIMLDSRGTPKIIDFGLSKVKESLQLSKATTRSGTEEWTAPEKKRGAPSTPACDVFSLGLVALFVLTLKKPPASPAERSHSVVRHYKDDMWARMALACASEEPSQRPASATVAAYLLTGLPIFQGGSGPAVGQPSGGGRPSGGTQLQQGGAAASGGGGGGGGGGASKAEALRQVVAKFNITESDLDKGDQSGRTLLHKAAKEGRVDDMRLLLQAGATVDSRDDYGGTPLMTAALYGKVDCVKLLVEAGADRNAKAKGGETALAYARRGASKGWFDKSRLPDVERALK